MRWKSPRQPAINMPKKMLCVGLGFLAICFGAVLQAGPIYYNTSSATQAWNTLGRVLGNGASNTTLFTAVGPGVNNVSRCTAVAVDGLNGKLFSLDIRSGSLWSVNLDGGGLALVKSGLTNYPTGIALDVLHERIYFTTSSVLQEGNTIQRMNYAGNSTVTVFTATGVSPGNGVSRCTAIALDVANSKIFIADAGTGTIWSMNLLGAA